MTRAHQPGAVAAIPVSRNTAASHPVTTFGFMAQPAPDRRFPRSSVEAAAAYQLVHDELLLDGNSRQNLATFCQTWVEPQVRTLMEECIGKNLIDRDEYPQMAQIEARCVRMLADLWHAPSVCAAVGCSTTGSSEAAMLGGLAMKLRWRGAAEKSGRSRKRPNLVCGPVQVCWHKFARYFDVELREIPCSGPRLALTPAEVLRRCDADTIGVVATLGLTYTLVYEPVAALAQALDDLEERTGLDIPIHVDAASGGFVAPFIHPELEWDFRLPRVRSINASGHKFGLAPLGCGWALWRAPEDLPPELVFRVSYLGGNLPTFGLNFSRPGGQVAAQYYTFVRLGHEGYRTVNQACADVGIWFADRVREIPVLELIYDGRGGIPGCVWTLKRGVPPKFTLHDVAERLRLKGWQIPAYPLPSRCEQQVVQRVVARLGFSRDLAALLLADLRKAIDDLQSSKVARNPAGANAGYHHT